MDNRNQEWIAFAPSWIERCRKGETNREGFLDEWMLNIVGDVTGRSIIDLGCGEGRFSRMMAQRGAAHVLGIDLCPPLLEAAQATQTSKHERYQHGDIQALDAIPDAVFDLAISYLSLIDVPNLTATIAEAHRVLNPNGRFVICNLSPIATATNQRVTDPDGSRNAFRVERYFDESSRMAPFGTHILTNYHRTFSTYINTFLGAGFRLVRLLEPTPSDANLVSYPGLANEREAPTFVIYDLIKEGTG